MEPHKRVLLVEDDPRVGAVMADLLEAGGYDVDGPYRTLADAMAALADHLPDCAVLDIHLRRQDSGLLAMDLARYDIPFILCSGLDTGERMGKAFPAAPFIRKDQLARRLLPALHDTIH